MHSKTPNELAVDYVDLIILSQICNEAYKQYEFNFATYSDKCYRFHPVYTSKFNSQHIIDCAEAIDKLPDEPLLAANSYLLNSTMYGLE